jgi:hypothetical protein
MQIKIVTLATGLAMLMLTCVTQAEPFKPASTEAARAMVKVVALPHDAFFTNVQPEDDYYV